VYTRALAKEWTRAGHDVTVLSQEPHPEQYDLGGARTVRPDVGGLHEVREGSLAVDLDDGDRRTVGRLQLGIAADVDALEVACTHLVDDLERPLAEVAPLRGVEHDSRDRGLA
jgi:hypothetical protein